MTLTDIDRNAPAIVRLERIIAAPLEQVWGLHTRVEDWPSWQHDIAGASIDGDFAAASSITWTTAGIETPIVSTIAAVEPRRSVLWGGPASGIVGIHRWTFEPTDGGTRVITEESWSGVPIDADPTQAKGMLETSLNRWLDFLAEAATKSEAVRQS